ncbi:alkaline phosphatase family protein [archaeon]|nr:MAG: alkaline phosphatase family protein [archaeon]
MTEHSKYPVIAFASCNRQNLPQNFWETILKEAPSHFLWLGDAVYAKGHSINKLHKAFQELLASSNYQQLVQKAVVDGVWDDHDYGVNDAGADAGHSDERQSEYLAFLQGSGYKQIGDLIHQEGLYHSLDIPISSNSRRHIKVLFLDTRTFRSVHYIRSLGEFRFPLSAIIASAIRGAYSVMGYGRSYDGKILGEAQWGWLEDTLKHNTADAHIIISSIQVLTSNPVFESWGHFPVEKQRLLALLDTHKKNHNTVFLSGDVHLGEVSKVTYTYTPPSPSPSPSALQLVEVTSSGLTHTCACGKLNGVLCPIMMDMFSAHRVQADAYYTGRNYGVIHVLPVENSTGNFKLQFEVKSLEQPGSTVLTHTLTIPYSDQDPNTSPYPSVASIHAPDFPLLPLPVRVLVYVFVMGVVYVGYRLMRRVLGGVGHTIRSKRE